jgi:hypothetical protein
MSIFIISFPHPPGSRSTPKPFSHHSSYSLLRTAPFLGYSKQFKLSAPPFPEGHSEGTEESDPAVQRLDLGNTPFLSVETLKG